MTESNRKATFGFLAMPLVAVGLTVAAIGFSLHSSERRAEDQQAALADEAMRRAQVLRADERDRRNAADRMLGAERSAIFELVREYRSWESERESWQLVDAIHEEATGAGLDPLIVASIVARESSFLTDAVSHAGAMGLMQLRPFVARDVAERNAVEWTGSTILHEPQTNVRLGVQYFKELLDRFDGDERLALAAYNLGPTRLRRRISRGGFDGSDYALNVLAVYESLSERRDATLAAG